MLVLAPPGLESDDLFADLSRREDLVLLRVPNAAAARRAIDDMPVKVVVACPDASDEAIEEVLGRLDAVRPGTPVLAVRGRRSTEPAAWSARGVGVLRMPLLPGVLGRSVDVVLGMKRR